jgi:2-dehydro-3-deoxygluconokinase
MPRYDLTTFGEGGLRLGVPAGTAIQTASAFEVYIAGTEANVACTLSLLGWSSSWMSCVADDPIGERVLHPLRGSGVDLSGVIRKKNVRTGVYFIEHAYEPRPIRVFFDRKNTGAALLTASEVNWDHLLDARITHQTGITAGISKTALDIVTTSLRKAKEAGVMTSFDVNHRNLLWTTEEARQAITPMFGSIDVLFCSLRDAQAVFGIDAEFSAMPDALARLSDAKYVVVSNGAEGVVGLSPNGKFSAPARKTVIIDRAGAGDAMASGVLHGILRGDFELGLRYGQVLAAMVMSQHGDRVVATLSEVDHILACDRQGIER